jgi:hypothetical protein
VEIKELDEERIVFDMIGVSAPIANAFRRILIAEVPIAAVTPSNTTPTFTVNLNSVINYNILPLIIPSGYSIRATVNDTTSGGINAIAYGGDF